MCLYYVTVIMYQNKSKLADCDGVTKCVCIRWLWRYNEMCRF